MRPSSTIGIAGMALTLIGCVGGTPSVGATDGDFSLNGTYAATSDGTYATTDYAFHPEETVRSVWTIQSHCSTVDRCAGSVTSDQGWSAPLTMQAAHVWYVERDVPNWETCPDGSTFAGHQTFMFYPSNADGVTQIGSPYLEGRDKTVGPRYACGTAKYGKGLTIVMPFQLEKVP